MKNRKSLLILAILVAQIVAIGFLVVRYERVVTKGTEVRFRCQAYDPSDPFRGRYLRTRVEESCTNFAFEVTSEHRYDWRRRRLFARIELQEGFGKIVEVAEEPSGEGLWVRPERVYIRPQKSGQGVAEISLPSQFFLNEKRAPEAEKVLNESLRDNETKAVAVYRVLDREIVLVDIEIDGRSIREIL